MRKLLLLLNYVFIILTCHAQNVFYGTTSQGGLYNNGVIFEFNPSTNSYINKHDFDGLLDGVMPFGNLVKASNGKLYGVTIYGGINNVGVLFEYDPSVGVFTKKIDFDGLSYGGSPFSLMQAINGNLYGLCQLGGLNNFGVLFEYDINTGICTKKIDFDGIGNGSNPAGNVIQVVNGSLYFTTQQGGINNKGALCEYNLATGICVKKFDFDTANGIHPVGNLVEVSNGKLYGTCSFGGVSNFGTLFEFDLNSNIYNKKIDFNGTANGSTPTAGLTLANNGKIYSTTQTGGIYDFGTLYEYDPFSSNCNKIIDFDGTSFGKTPLGRILESSNGKFYGTTYEGGLNNVGVLYEYDLSNNLFTKKSDFNSTDGANPAYGKLVEVNLLATNNLELGYKSNINCYPNPNNGEFDLFVNEFNSAMIVEVYNSFGQIVLKESISQNKVTLNIDNQSNGIYFVRIINDNKSVSQHKIIKQ